MWGFRSRVQADLPYTRAGRVEGVVLKLDGLCDGQKGPLGLGGLFGSHIQHRDQKLQQVPGEEPDVPGHLQPAQA